MENDWESNFPKPAVWKAEKSLDLYCRIPKWPRNGQCQAFWKWRRSGLKHSWKSSALSLPSQVKLLSHRKRKLRLFFLSGENRTKGIWAPGTSECRTIMLKTGKVHVYIHTNYWAKSTLLTTQLSECWPPGLICLSSRLEKSFWGIQLAQEKRPKDDDI